jgi:hypothetical protein
VQVAYVGPDAGVRVITARAAVLACPKLVVKQVLQDIEPERRQAIERLRYRCALVANACIEGECESFPALSLLGDGHTESDPQVASTRQGASRVVLGTYAQRSKRELVLTLYRGVPYEGARPALYAPDAFTVVKAAFDHQVRHEILPLLGLDPAGLKDLRVARWGHPLPLAALGQIADGLPEVLGAPFRDRVFFVEQDNWALPAFETAVGEALRQAPTIEALLRGGVAGPR